MAKQREHVVSSKSNSDQPAPSTDQRPLPDSGQSSKRRRCVVSCLLQRMTSRLLPAVAATTAGKSRSGSQQKKYNFSLFSFKKKISLTSQHTRNNSWLLVSMNRCYWARQVLSRKGRRPLTLPRFERERQKNFRPSSSSLAAGTPANVTHVTVDDSLEKMFPQARRKKDTEKSIGLFSLQVFFLFLCG